MEPLLEHWHNYMKCPYDYPFDIKQNPDPYGYFEVLMDRDGIIYEAPNGHQRGLVMMIARDKGITPEQVDAEADVMYYTEYLLKESEAIMIWHKFYMGHLNDKQQIAIQSLKDMGFMASNAFNRVDVYYE